MSAESLRRAGWAGLQDSMPRAALLSIHARVKGATPSSWEHPSLVQLWGPRFNTYVVPKIDRALYSLGRYPDDARGRRVADEMAAGFRAVVGDRRLPDRDIAGALEVGNAIRYAAPTGTMLIRWEGARAPTIWSVARPDVDPADARRELGRRYLHFFGPTTPASFGKWAGIGARGATATFAGLDAELVPATTPIGEGWILATDEGSFRSKIGPSAPARLLPSGDSYYLLQNRDRELLVPDAARRDELWTSRVWPGAVLVSGEIVGVWRRADWSVSIDAWRALGEADRAAVEAEAASLPLPGLRREIEVTWTS